MNDRSRIESRSIGYLNKNRIGIVFSCSGSGVGKGDEHEVYIPFKVLINSCLINLSGHQGIRFRLVTCNYIYN